jgi:nucleoside-diphosphate-sugar epimerase
VHPRIQLVEGDATDFPHNLLLDCAYVIHVAGVATPNLSFDHYHKGNVKTTMNVLHAALENKVKRFVFVSTSNTIGYADHNGLGNEDRPMREPFDRSHYAVSKLKAEKHLLKFCDRIEVVIANPTFMIGAYDFKPTSGRIILNGLGKKIIFHPPGGKNFVHVEDAARGLVRCLRFGKNGEKYLLAGENLSFRDFYKRLCELSGTSPLLVEVPKVLLSILGLLGDLLVWLHFKTILSSAGIRTFTFFNFYSNQKSIRELKMQYQPIEKAIADAVEFFGSYRSKP